MPCRYGLRIGSYCSLHILIFDSCFQSMNLLCCYYRFKGDDFLEIRVLRYFLAVVREESITKAAEVLHITQPTLSRQLTQLEEDIGVKLFHRGTRKISLTNEGRLLRRRAEEIIELADKTAQELLEQEQELEGTISIGCGELASMRIVADACGSFQKKYPRITFDLYTATADEVRERMDRGLIDIGLLLEPVNTEKYDYIRLSTREEWCVLMRPDDSLTEKQTISPKDLKSLPVLLPRRMNVRSELSNWFGRDFGKLHIAFTGNLTTNSAVMVTRGLGYALVIKGSASLLDQRQVVSRPLNPALSSSTVLAWKREQPFSQAAEKFISHLKDSLPHA